MIVIGLLLKLCIKKITNIIPDLCTSSMNTGNFKNLLEKIQKIQENYYNRSTKILKDFENGDQVKIHTENKRKPHENGIIINKHQHPRTFNVKTESGQIIKRNRKDLIKGINFNENNDSIEEPFETSEEPQIPIEVEQSAHDSPARAQVPSEQPVLMTSSGRVINKPSYLKNYVCLVKNCKD